jgi:hypothetical protein
MRDAHGDPIDVKYRHYLEFSIVKVLNKRQHGWGTDLWLLHNDYRT